MNGALTIIAACVPLEKRAGTRARSVSTSLLTFDLFSKSRDYDWG
jgi:hypothetical protein